MKGPAHVFLSAFASLESALLAFVLRRSGRDSIRQNRILPRLIGNFLRADYGKARRLLPDMNYEQFRERAPLQNYKSLLPFLEQIMEGGRDVLWPGSCSHFIALPDLPGDERRCVPVTADMGRHLCDAWRKATLLMCARGCPTALLHLPATWPARTHASSAAASSRQPFVLELPEVLNLCLKNPVAKPSHRPASPETGFVVLGAHQPSTLCSSLKRIRQNRNTSETLHVILLSPPFGINIEALKRELGVPFKLYEIFASPAGIVASQDGDFNKGLRLFTDQDIFFEFIPLKDYDDTRLSELKAKVVPVSQVQTGIDYLLVVSSPAGFCRCVTGELLRFVSTAPCRVQRMGRLENCLNIMGEFLTERTLADAISESCTSQGWEISNVHVAPVTTSSLTGHMTGLHEWWVELKPGTKQTPTGPMLAPILDSILQAHSDNYAQLRKSGNLGAPVVRLLMPGIFDLWFDQNGLRPGEIHLPICLPSRRIADALAKLVRFYV